MDDVRLTYRTLHPDVVVVTESWLHDNIPNDLVSLPNCALFRSDRTLPRRGGGVCVWINRNFSATQHTPLNDLPTINSVFIHLSPCDIILVAVYLPPDVVRQNADAINEHILSNLDDLCSQHPNSDIIICGDFNHLDPTELQTHFDVTNLVQEPTRGNSTLDVILTSQPISEYYRIDVGPPISTSDHGWIPLSRKQFCRKS